MSNTLTKSEKKLARELIDKGLQQEFKVGIENVGKLVEEWKVAKLENREAYLAIFKAVHDYDKHIARRYDLMRGSMYQDTVTDLLAEGLISEADVEGFGEQAKSEILHYAAVRRKWMDSTPQ